MSPRRPLVHRLGVLAVAAVLLAGCGDDDGGDDDGPDELNFCRLALVNAPVAEADAPVWRRLEELAPDELDDAVDVLREAAEELEEFEEGSRELLAAEFELRFRPDYLAARDEVEAFLADECREYLPTTTTSTTTTTTPKGSGSTTGTSDTSTTTTEERTG